MFSYYLEILLTSLLSQKTGAFCTRSYKQNSILGSRTLKKRQNHHFSTLLQAFLDKSDEWVEAEAAIVNLRAKIIAQEDPGATLLKSVVSDEVDYVYALWSKNYQTALEKARLVSDRLSGDIVRAYRGWWYYLRGDSALMLFGETQDSSHLSVATDSFHRASRCSHAVSWFSQLSRLTQSQEGTEEGQDAFTSFAIEHIKTQLENLGFQGNRFEKQMATFL